MMATTIMISTSVKPEVLRRIFMLERSLVAPFGAVSENSWKVGGGPDVG
jgi:hypothetical protein